MLKLKNIMTTTIQQIIFWIWNVKHLISKQSSLKLHFC